MLHKDVVFSGTSPHNAEQSVTPSLKASYELFGLVDLGVESKPLNGSANGSIYIEFKAELTRWDTVAE